MNNVIYHNIIRKMGKKIEEEKKETIGIVKDGYLCTEDCWIRHLDKRTTNKADMKCGKREFCDWDLRSNFWKKETGGLNASDEDLLPAAREKPKRKRRKKKFD